MSITHIGFAIAATGWDFLFFDRLGDGFRVLDLKLTLTMILSPDAYTSLSATSDDTWVLMRDRSSTLEPPTTFRRRFLFFFRPFAPTTAFSTIMSSLTSRFRFDFLFFPFLVVTATADFLAAPIFPTFFDTFPSFSFFRRGKGDGLRPLRPLRVVLVGEMGDGE